MNGKTKSVRLTLKNHRLLKRIKRQSGMNVPLEGLANAAIDLGVRQLDIYNKDRKPNK